MTASGPRQSPELPTLPSLSALHRRGLLRGGAVVSLGLLTGQASAAGDLAAPALVTSRPKLTIIWNPASLCLVVIGLAQRQGIFEKHGLDVETLNVGSDTSAILEALALGKADATSNFLLRFLKPLEAGFDVKLTAGTHAGCSILIASRDAGIETLQDLRGKRIGMSDLSSPMKLLYEIHLNKNGVPPELDYLAAIPVRCFHYRCPEGRDRSFCRRSSERLLCNQAQQGEAIRASFQRYRRTRPIHLLRASDQRQADSRQSPGCRGTHPRHGRSLEKRRS